MNIGHFSKLEYDKDTLKDRTTESVGPANYRLSTDQHYNNQGCFHVDGPIGGYGASTTVGDVVSPRLALVDLETVITNRNVRLSKDRKGVENPINVTKQPLKHARQCNDWLVPNHSRITNPASSYRGLSINRFENLPMDPQNHIFVDFSVNTTLEAKDNWVRKNGKMRR